ncbi:MAG: exodeoxyribonuclease large subunit [Candidatus Cloacimonadota bacterium]|nr:exodeoxyribonuclease large subunit [Candidatus Cloacimonadota bacterium]
MGIFCPYMDNVTVFSVFEITRHIRQVIETSIEALYVKGEVSNFVHHSSGHIYFNLKDEYATLRCTFFRNQNYRLDFQPANGQSVICYGHLTVYEKGGSYNLNVMNMTPAGLGDMQAKFEALKKKLQAEGLFDESRKQALPRYPERIGIITSPTGAALQDITNVLSRRYPIQAWVYPALVQGPNAAESVIKGLEYFNHEAAVDLIIVTRGGGSQEDLFCFNDEKLARAIAASRIPVISAVGHEIDFTISDFVADLRAPTPSAAAEIAVPNRDDLLNYLNSLSQRLNLSVNSKLSSSKQELSSLALEFSRYHPQKIFQTYQQRFDMATLALEQTKQLLREPQIAFEHTRQRFIYTAQRSHENRLSKYRNQLDRMQEHLNFHFQQKFDTLKHTLLLEEQKLELASPQYLLQKGWTLVSKDDHIIRSSKEINQGESLKITFHDGKIEVEVTDCK